MKVDTQTHGSVCVAVPHGPLAGDDVASFRHALAALIDQRSGRVVLDVSDVSYFDSAGIEALLEVCAGQPGAAARPRVARLGDTCREALDLTDVLGRLNVFDTVENAIRSFKR